MILKTGEEIIINYEGFRKLLVVDSEGFLRISDEDIKVENTTSQQLANIAANGQITARVKLTQAQYDALKAAGQLIATIEYVIVG